MAEVESGEAIPVSSKLYLFTFLATLLLLLGISALIVFRSLVIRRRLERRINHAIQEGLVAAPRTPGSKHNRLTKRPKLHDVWVECGGGTWEELHPLSLRLKAVNARAKLTPKPRLIAVNEAAFWSMMLSSKPTPVRATSQVEVPNKLDALDDGKAEGASPAETMVTAGCRR